MQENLEGLDGTIRTSVDSARQHPLGRMFGAILLISLGVYFLLNNLGWFGWLNIAIWPLLLIGLGVWLLRKRA